MKCKLIFFNSFDGEKFELNSDLSPDQSDNIDEVIKYIFYNYKKEFNQYIKGLKSLNRHSISRNNVKSDLFSKIVGNYSITRMKEEDTDFKEFEDDNTPNILLLIGGIPKGINRYSTFEVILRPDGTPIYVLNKSSFHYKEAKEKLRQHLKTIKWILLLKDDKLSKQFTQELLDKIVESVNKYNKKINNKIAKLDTNDEDYDNKLANLNSQKVYSNFSTRKLFLLKFLVDPMLREALPKELTLSIKRFLDDSVEVRVEYNLSYLNDLLKTWSVHTERKGVNSRLTYYTLSLKDLISLMLENGEFENAKQKFDKKKPIKPKAIKKKDKETDKKYKERLKEYNDKLKQYEADLKLYNAEKEEYINRNNNIEKEVLKKLKEEWLPLMYYHNLTSGVTVTVSGDNITIKSSFLNIALRYFDSAYEKVLQNLVLSETYRGFDIYYLEVNGNPLYFYSSKNLRVSGESMGMPYKSIDEIKDKIDDNYKYTRFVELSHLEAYMQDTLSGNLFRGIRSYFKNLSENTLIRLYDFALENLSDTLSKNELDLLRNISYDDLLAEMKLRVPDVDKFIEAVDNDPLNLAVLTLKIAQKLGKGKLFTNAQISETDFNEILESFAVMEKSTYIVHEQGALIAIGQTQKEGYNGRLYLLDKVDTDELIYSPKDHKYAGSVDKLVNICKIFKTHLGVNYKTFSDNDIKSTNKGYSTVVLDSGEELTIKSNSKAFIYNGIVYVNLSKATATDALHEYSHLLIEYIRINHPEIYLDLINLINKSIGRQEDLAKYIRNYKNRSEHDIYEEYMADLLAIYLRNRYDINTLFDEIKLPEKDKLKQLKVNKSKSIQINLFNMLGTLIREGIEDSELTDSWYANVNTDLTLMRKLSNAIELNLVQEKCE